MNELLASSRCERILLLLAARTGCTFDAGRRAAAEAGIDRAMGRAKTTDINAYYDRLVRDRGALEDLVEEILIGETYFFRQTAQFEFLARRVIPELRRQSNDLPFRIWSAGCASGEEAYSLAILFAEQGLAERTRILATDISRAALERARAGVYRAWSLRGEGAAAARPYLRSQAEGYVLDERIRRRVRFEYLNLAVDLYPSLATGTCGMHLILCRNVLIYFDQPTIERVARRLYESLAPGGWLLTGASDPPLAEHAPFLEMASEAGVAYQRGPAPKIASVTEAADACRSGIREDADLSTPGILTKSATPPALSHAPSPNDSDVSVDLIRATANLDAAAAERLCAAELSRQPLSPELYYLHAVLLLELDRDEEAAVAARRVIYLDRSLTVAHFLLGTISLRRGDLAEARRAFRNAYELAVASNPDEVAPLSEGESNARLAAAAAAQLANLEAVLKATPA